MTVEAVTNGIDINYKMVESFVQYKATYYFKRFSAINKKNRVVGLNIAALVFCSWWLFYRRMYSWLLLVIVYANAVIYVFHKVPGLSIISGVSIDLQVIVLMYVIPNVVFALFGDFILYKRFVKALPPVNVIDEYSDEEITKMLKERGGVSIRLDEDLVTQKWNK